jgi:hypothetical protein
MPLNISTPPAIRSLRAMIRLKAGAGATSTRYGSISPTAPRRSLARFHVTFEVTSGERIYGHNNRSPRDRLSHPLGGTPKGQIEANVAYWRRTLDLLAEAAVHAR